MSNPSLQLPLPEKDALLRRRLFADFERGLDARLTLVSAPAG